MLDAVNHAGACFWMSKKCSLACVNEADVWCCTGAADADADAAAEIPRCCCRY